MFHLNKKCFLTLITVILGAFVQAYVIKVFIQPANLLSKIGRAQSELQSRP